MDFTHKQTDGIALLHLRGDLLGLGDEARLLAFVDEQLAQEPPFCAVDISQVGYMNSVGLTLLIKLLTKYRNQNGEVVLIGPSKLVSNMLLTTKLNAIFQIFGTEAEALAALQALRMANAQEKTSESS